MYNILLNAVLLCALTYKMYSLLICMNVRSYTQYPYAQVQYDKDQMCAECAECAECTHR